MHYLLDTRFFILMRDYYPDTFPSFWKKLDEAVKNGTVSSVAEVKKEIEKYGGEQQHLLGWIKLNKHVFTQPSVAEQDRVREIFNVKEFKSLLSKQALNKGDPSADPFVIAKAMMKQATVVTGEKPANRNQRGEIQGSPKIPDVCDHFNVSWLSPEDFMRQEGWKF